MALDYGEGGSFTVTMDGPFASGGSGGALKMVSISAPAEDWKGGESPYSQVVAVDGVTVSSKVDVQMTVDQMKTFDGLIIAFQAVNNNGVITLFSYGNKPSTDIVLQATISEVLGEGSIQGNIFTTTHPQADYGQTDSTKADFIKNKPAVFVVGNTVPEGPAIWFNTAPGGSVNDAALLSLDDDETGYDVQAVVGDEVYGVGNMTVNQGATDGGYDFTVR